MNLKIINLTPHDITILNQEREVVEVILRSGKIARLDISKELIVSQKEKLFSHHVPLTSHIPFFVTKYGIPYLSTIDKDGKEIKRIQFPERKEGTIYIVSGVFRDNYDRVDFWQPGELVCNENGQPIGCIGLSQ
jgi:hypothetical protein